MGGGLIAFNKILVYPLEFSSLFVKFQLVTLLNGYYTSAS